MVAAATSFTASSHTPVVNSVITQPVAASNSQLSNSSSAENTPNTARRVEQSENVQAQRAQAQENAEAAQAAREQQREQAQQQQVEPPDPPSSVALSDTFRIIGSAPDFQVHSTGNNVYLTHSSGYILSLATGQERVNIQFNDSSSKVESVMKSGSEALPNPASNNIPNNGYTRSGNLDLLIVPTGLLQNIQA